MSVGVVVGEEVRVGGAGMGGEGELAIKGGGEGDGNRPQAAIDAANTRYANKALVACTITRVLRILGYP